MALFKLDDIEWIWRVPSPSFPTLSSRVPVARGNQQIEARETNDGDKREEHVYVNENRVKDSENAGS